MDQKMLLGVIVVLVIVVAVLVGYIFGGLGKGGVSQTVSAGPSGLQGQGGQQLGPQSNPPITQGPSPATGITEAHLESVPIGTSIGPGTVGTPATVFGKWLMMGISGQVNTPNGTRLTVKIFDANGVEVPNNYPGSQLNGPGGFGACCLMFPQTAGDYTMKFYLDGVESRSAAFKVVADDYCESDSDCACGMHKLSGGCFYGNKNLADTARQCPDFCTGEGNEFAIKCVNGTCAQVLK
jgi:hypothetical protein